MKSSQKTPNQRFQDWLLRLIFPVCCVRCEKESDWLCPECLKLFTPQPLLRCALCGKAAEKGICERCKTKTKIDQIVSLFSYQQTAIADLLKVGKYEGRHQVYSFLGNSFHRFINRHLPEGDWCLCPVPISRQRLVERGFNQAEVLARSLPLDWPIWQGVKVFQDRPHQANLDKKERLKNMKGAFRLTKKPPPQIVLVDDIVTTGATLGELARLLKKGKAEKIVVLTIAHG